MSTTTMRFEFGETIICYATVKDEAGALVDPSTSTKITIKDPSGVAVVTDQAMTRKSLGVYSYDYTPVVGAEVGWYTARVTVVYGTRTTKQDDGFELIP